MPLTVNAFQALAQSTRFSSRDIVVNGGEGAAATARLGNFVLSSGKEVNDATMKAFRSALEAEYGVFGTHAFDMVLGSRKQMGHSLRASDVTKTISKLGFVKQQRWVSEMNRQLDTDPAVWSLSHEVQNELRAWLDQHPYGDPPAKLWTFWSHDVLAKEVAKTIRRAIPAATAAVDARNGNTAGEAPSQDRLRMLGMAGGEVAPDEPTGLRNFSKTSVFEGYYTSMEDRMKSGRVGEGLRVNRHFWRPALLDRLKTNGVEPGFIYRNDWTLEDTGSLMEDIWSDGNAAALDELVEGSRELREMRDRNPPAPRRDLAMKAGRRFPGYMAAAAECILERELRNPGSAIARAFRERFPNVGTEELFPAGGGAPSVNGRRLIAEVKKALFVELRDAVMHEPEGSADFEKSPVFAHFADKNILKLDYNERDRFGFPGRSGSEGNFRLPERVGNKFGALKGWVYRTFRLTTADGASIGAVREALANDITRIMGVPAQELNLVRGEYSDGHPKFMLSAKYAKGYKDLEDGFLQDGHVVAPPGAKEIEPLGRYKALFLALADRDAVGSHGQNKGLVGGRFFAIDPGHSLEGNGGDLDIRDDLSFTDRNANATNKRFGNFSVFDDDTRFAKFQGVLKLRELSQSGRLGALFDDYRAKFDPAEDGIPAPERELRRKITDNINAMEAEFRGQIGRILEVCAPQLAAFDALAPDPPGDAPTPLQENAIETIGNLEKLTSPTRWTSPNGTVDLKHLAVEPRTRVPWQLTVRPNGDLVYATAKTLDAATRNRLLDFCARGGAAAAVPPEGGLLVTVPAESRERFFAAMGERNIIDEKHADELPGRVARDLERGRRAAEELARQALENGV